MKNFFNKKTLVPYLMAIALALPVTLVFIVVTHMRAEEAEPFGDDFWADFFKSLEEASTETPKETTTKPEKEHESTTKKESPSEKKEDSIVKPAGKISTDPIELFQNPPVETISNKSKNIVMPVKEAKNAAISIIKNFLNSLALVEAKLNDEYLREQWNAFAAPCGDLKVILNFIVEKNEYLSLFLVPPAETKELQETFSKIRKQIVTLKGKVETLIKKLTQEEEALERAKEESLASFGKEEKKETKKAKSKKFDIKKKQRGAKKTLKNKELLSKTPFISEE